MKKLLILLCLCTCILCSSAVCADTIVYDDLIDDIITNRTESIYDIELNAPFEKIKSGIREEIDVETGNLFVSYNFFSLAGHGEQNVDFGAVYNVNLAKEMNESITEAGDGNTTVVKSNSENMLFCLGVGWRINLPFVEKVELNNKTERYVHLPNGSVYIADSDSENGLADYELTDLVYSTANVSLGDETYPFSLYYRDGVRYYFDSLGLCCAKTDRFMNTVIYEWYEYDDEKYRLESIKDTCGRIITIDHADSIVSVSYGNSKYIIERSETENGGYKIDSITDPAGRRTVFEYYNAEVNFNFYPDLFEDASNTVIAMSKILYPTGLTTCYEYTKSSKWLYEEKDGTMEYLRLKKRYDIENNKNTNILEYSYIREPSGCPNYKSDEISESYEYSTVEKDSFGNTTTYTHNSKHNPVRTATTSDGYKSEESAVIFDGVYNLPVVTINKQYNKDGLFRETTTERTYDSRGNLLSTDTYQNGDKGKHKVNYGYSGSYDICTYESYKQNDSVTIETIRNLDPQEKYIASESIHRNGTLIKKDEYKYNIFGDVVLSKIQTDKNTYLTTEYIYDKPFPYPQEIIQKNITDADGVSVNICTSYEYDSYGNTTCITLNDGTKRKYTYDPIGRVTSETLEDGCIRTKEYDDKANVLTTVDAVGTKLIYEYDPSGALISVTDPVTKTILLRREYDIKKRLVTETDGGGAIAYSTYDSKDRLTSYSVKDIGGKLYSNTSLTYNDADNTVTVTEGDINKKIKSIYTYDMYNRLTKQTLVTDASKYITSYEYDYIGNNISFTDESGNVTMYEYDVFGNPIKCISPLGNTEQYTYDFLGNVTQYVNAEGEIQEFFYDSLGRQISEKKYFDGIQSEYKTYYDFLGNSVKTVDENGGETLYEYDRRGMLISSKAFAETGVGIKTEYEYDGEGRLTKTAYGSISDPKQRNVTQNSYDHLGNLIKRIDNSGKMSYYEYDSMGRLMKATDPKGIETCYKYDVLGRQTRISNGIDPDTVYSYNILGELESVTQGDKAVAYIYDERGRLIHSVNGTTTDIYSYDERGNVLEHVIKASSVGEMKTAYEYDKDNRITKLITPLGIQSMSYDGAGRLIRSENSHTGSIKQIMYDKRGLPTSSTTKLGDTTLSTENNVYDLVGNKIRSEENGYVRSYRYDGLSRLTGVTENGKDTLYEFDSYGNISKEHEMSGNRLNTTVYSYDADNRLILSQDSTNSISYEYDANGNMTRQYDRYSDVHYEYDGYNRLRDIIKNDEIISYEYSPDGLRDKKHTREGTTRFVYDAGSVCAEILPNGTSYSYYRADGIIGSVDSFGNKMYYSQNTHGDVTAIYDSKGNILNDYRYSAYGITQTVMPDGINQPNIAQWYAETNAVHNPFGYCGEYTDNETGFVYLRNRYYDPITGRFTSEDPIRDGLNWYVYCGNNPINFVDPLGTRHSGECITTGTGTYQDVWKIQNYLNNHGYVGADGKPLVKDGIFGANTLYAVKNYQKNQGLAVDGIVGDNTWASMGFDNILKDVPSWEVMDFENYDYTNDMVTDEGWVITATAVGIASAGTAIAKYGISVATSAGASIGTNFGSLGTLIKNPDIRIQSFSKHALERMSERNITQDMVNVWVSTGKALKQTGDKILYISKQGAAVVTEAGKLITAYGKEFYDDAMKEIVKQLFRK